MTDFAITKLAPGSLAYQGSRSRHPELCSPQLSSLRGDGVPHDPTLSPQGRGG